MKKIGEKEGEIRARKVPLTAEVCRGNDGLSRLGEEFGEEESALDS